MTVSKEMQAEGSYTSQIIHVTETSGSQEYQHIADDLHLQHMRAVSTHLASMMMLCGTELLSHLQTHLAQHRIHTVSQGVAPSSAATLLQPCSAAAAAWLHTAWPAAVDIPATTQPSDAPGR